MAAQAKARALAHRLGGSGSAADADADAATAAAAARGAYEEVCGAWWAEVQQHARGEATAAPGCALRVLEYSLLPGDRLAIWVLSGAGELLGSATVPTAAYRRDAVGRVVCDDGMVRMFPAARESVGDKEKDSCCFGARKYGIRSLLEEARGSMKVRGRDAMAGSSADLKEECELKLADAGSQEGETPSERGNKCTICHLHLRLCACQTSKKKTTAADDEARERALLRELYAALLAPVEAALAGADELLIVPHKELFEVPWAALIDAQGRFLIERCVLRVAPSLRVAQQAAGKVTQRPGHVVLVGNPLPIQTRFRPLPFAEQEAQGVHDILNRAGVEVNQKHFFRSDLTPKATKANVKKSLQGAGWVHFACHADIDTDSLVLAVPDSSDPEHAQPNLSRLEVQGSDEAADKSEGVRLGYGATAFMSACNTAKGKIKAEGVVGMSRGFQMAGAAATVVSLWSVDDLSTAVLMQQTYLHLVEGLTVPQALRLAMLRLARRPALHQPAPGDQETGAGERSGADTAEGARGGGEELGGFRKLEEGGSRSAGGGSAVPALVQGFLDMLEGQGSSSRGGGAPVQPVRIHEDEAERRAYWREFCRRNVAPTCVLDFPFADHGADHGRLNLSGDERLLERLYCFEDHEDDAHQLLGGERRRVILKVHTLLKWGDRGDKLYLRAVKVTAVKVLLARVCSCRC